VKEKNYSAVFFLSPFSLFLNHMEVFTLGGNLVAVIQQPEWEEEACERAASFLGVHAECVWVLRPQEGSAWTHCLARAAQPPVVALVSPRGKRYGAPLLSGPADVSYRDRAKGLCASLADAIEDVTRKEEIMDLRWNVSVQTLGISTGAWLFVEVVPGARVALVMVNFERPPRGSPEAAAAQIQLETKELVSLDATLLVEENLGCEPFEDLETEPEVLLDSLTVWLEELRAHCPSGVCQVAVRGHWQHDGAGTLEVSDEWTMEVGRL